MLVQDLAQFTTRPATYYYGPNKLKKKKEKAIIQNLRHRETLPPIRRERKGEENSYSRGKGFLHLHLFLFFDCLD